MSTTVLYMGPRRHFSNDVLAYRVFLKQALRPAGVRELLTQNHSIFRWSGSVVFFDRAGAPEDWVGIVKNLVEQSNAVIVISESKESIQEDVRVLRDTKASFQIRTWEAEAVRESFQRARRELVR